ncbi:Pectinesterase [Bertholletia excelsa]
MKENQPPLSLLHLSAISAVLVFTVQPISTVGSPDPNNTTNTDYIRTSCAATLYPDVCYTTLSAYANAVQQDPARLARAAIGVSLSNARNASDYVSNATAAAIHGSADNRSIAAIKDCSSTLGDALDEISRSLKQMRHLGGGGQSLEFQLSNVQTWMSAALTNEDTCTDGFQDAPDGPMKTGVCDRVVQVKQVTSNALALVNCYVSKVRTP